MLDWELAHLGDPVEDIGWLCARAWRFGGPGRVGGFGTLDQFLNTYCSASGRVVNVDRVRWWEAYATVKWAVICLLQGSAHLSGTARSVELAAIGRRVCESEGDLLVLMGVRMPTMPPPGPGQPDPGGRARGARPRRQPLWPALDGRAGGCGPRTDPDTKVMTSSEGTARFEARVAATSWPWSAESWRSARPHWPPTTSASAPSVPPTRPRWPRPSEPAATTTTCSRWVQCWLKGCATNSWWSILRISKGLGPTTDSS